MRLGILRISIVDVIGNYQFNPGLLRHFKKLLVHQSLLRDAVILKLKEVIVFPENILILKGSLFGLVIKSLRDITLHLPGKTRAQCDDTLVVFSQKLFIYTRPVIVSLDKAF